MAAVKIHVLFKGRVQGVGFRFTVERIATQLGVTGWVKNVASGDVEVVAEGKQEVLDTFLEKIRGYFSRYIQDEDIETAQASGAFSDFEIRF